MKRAKLLLLALFTVTMLFGCGKKEEALSEQPTENKPEEVTESVIIETGNMVTSYLTTSWAGKQFFDITNHTDQ